MGVSEDVGVEQNHFQVSPSAMAGVSAMVSIITMGERLSRRGSGCHDGEKDHRSSEITRNRWLDQREVSLVTKSMRSPIFKAP
jgi:hypothetical protein